MASPFTIQVEFYMGSIIVAAGLGVDCSSFQNLFFFYSLYLSLSLSLSISRLLILGVDVPSDYLRYHFLQDI
jgi:hypothetical protein